MVQALTTKTIRAWHADTTTHCLQFVFLVVNEIVFIEKHTEKSINMTSFKPINTKKFVKPTQDITPDTIYWKKLSVSSET